MRRQPLMMAITLTSLLHSFSIRRTFWPTSGALRHRRLTDIAVNVKSILALRARRLVSRQQTPTDETDEGESDERKRQSDRREIEHGEGLANRVGPKSRDDDICRRAYQGRQPNEQTGE